MPKIPVAARARLDDLAIPEDLRDASPPRVAHETERGRLVWSDCLDFLRGLDAGSVKLVVADPPYAIAKEEWDTFASEEEYVAWCDAWLAEVQRVLTPDGSAYVCGFSEILAEIKARSARRFAGGMKWLVWAYKNKANLGRDWGRSHESILHLRKGRHVLDVDAVRVPYNAHTTKYPARAQATSSSFGQGKPRADKWEPHPLGAKPRDVLECPILCNGMDEKTDHPTQKPEALIETLVRASSASGELVVDPFAGSGTTLVVADRLERRWMGCDADPRYVGMARTRLVASRPSR